MREVPGGWLAQGCSNGCAVLAFFVVVAPASGRSWKLLAAVLKRQAGVVVPDAGFIGRSRSLSASPLPSPPSTRKKRKKKEKTGVGQQATGENRKNIGADHLPRDSSFLYFFVFRGRRCADRTAANLYLVVMMMIMVMNI